MKLKITAAILIPFFVLGCASSARTASYQSFKTEKTSDLGEIYDRAAQHEGPERNPVIVIPGFLGSRLIDAGSKQVVWGRFDVTPIHSLAKKSKQLLEDSSLPLNAEESKALSLPMQSGKDLRDLKDTIVPDGVLEKVGVSLVGVPLHLGAYSYITEALGAGKYRFEPKNTKEVDYGRDYFTSFQFGYDWRRDLTETVKELHKFIMEKRSYLQKEYEKRYGIKDYDVRFDIVGHSMAGLLTRYYLLYGDADLPADGSLPEVTWKGARYINKLIVVGTPNAGMLDAFTELIEGIRFAPLLPKFHYTPAVLGTWVTYYELLPPTEIGSIVDEKNVNGPGLDIFDPELWVKMNWGLADPKQDRILRILLPGVETAQERRKIALDHLTKCLARAKQFKQAMSVSACPPKGTQVYLFAGDAVPTASKVAVNLTNGKIRVIETASGDGVVLRSSALYDQRTPQNWTPGLKSPICWSSVTFLLGAHMAITRDPTFTDNVLFLLLEQK